METPAALGFGRTQQNRGGNEYTNSADVLTPAPSPRRPCSFVRQVMAAGETETAEEQLAADADDLERLHGKGATRSKVRNGTVTTACIHAHVNVPSLNRRCAVCRRL